MGIEQMSLSIDNDYAPRMLGALQCFGNTKVTNEVG